MLFTEAERLGSNSMWCFDRDSHTFKMLTYLDSSGSWSPVKSTISIFCASGSGDRKINPTKGRKGLFCGEVSGLLTDTLGSTPHILAE